MREKGYGRVINTVSNSGILGNFGQSNYGAAKMGLVGFTRVLANEGRKYNIKANAIAPVAKTRMTEELLGAVGDKLAPEEVTPVVVLPGATRTAPSPARSTRSPAALVARFFIGLTPGYYKNRHQRRGRPRQLGRHQRRERLHRPRRPRRRAREALPAVEGRPTVSGRSPAPRVRTTRCLPS